HATATLPAHCMARRAGEGNGNGKAPGQGSGTTPGQGTGKGSGDGTGTGTGSGQGSGRGTDKAPDQGTVKAPGHDEGETPGQVRPGGQRQGSERIQEAPVQGGSQQQSGRSDGSGGREEEPLLR
ncbi:hypothetical protein ACFXAG_38130, partial [Streptomyces yangpuensis]